MSIISVTISIRLTMSRADIPDLPDKLEAGTDGVAGMALSGKPSTIAVLFLYIRE
ncbi:hypothetical protein [Methylobacter sp. BBA5.1]|uniref:hypothetical protein n=1 Tax=Methylobacter sp. BBA5.1 TaxID=1495064 RepID=UPI0013771D19|nr:hypothetical protein [Methylobacter sp. BBA5.1]